MISCVIVNFKTVSHAKEKKALSDLSYGSLPSILCSVDFSDLFICISSQPKVSGMCCVERTVGGTMEDEDTQCMQEN